MCIYRDCLPLYCVGIVLLINSCADRNDERWEELKALPYIEVCGEEVHTDKNFDGRDFYAVDSGRVLMSSLYNTDTLIYVGEIRDDSLFSQKGFLHKGRGPNEVLWFDFSYNPVAKEYMIMESNTSFPQFFLSIPSCDKMSIYDQEEWIHYPIEHRSDWSIGRFVQLSETKVLLACRKYGEEYIFAIMDISTQEITPVDFWPVDDFHGGNISKSFVYTSNAGLFVNYENHKVLYVCRWGKYAVLFDYRSGSLVKDTVMFDICPQYRQVSKAGDYRFKDSNKNGFKVRTDDKYIYFLSFDYKVENGDMVSPIEDYPFYYNDHLYVYNWNGEYIGKYKFDIPFYDFIVDAKTGWIYTCTNDLKTDDTEIYRYILPGL